PVARLVLICKLREKSVITLFFCLSLPLVAPYSWPRTSEGGCMKRSMRILLLAVIGAALGAATAFAEAPPRAEIHTMTSLPHRLSAPVSTFAPGLPAPAAKAFALRKPDAPGGGGNGRGGGGSTFTDAAVQTSYTSGFGATLLNSVEGIGANGSLPPDAN